jgi:signal transduction histidine kinase
LIAQALGGLILFQNWDKQAAFAQVSYMAQRANHIRLALDKLPASEHQTVLKAINTFRFQVHIADQMPVCSKTTHQGRSQHLQQHLEALLPLNHRFCLHASKHYIHVEIQLKQGNALILKHKRQHKNTLYWSLPLWLNLGLMLVAVLLLSWFAVHWLTSPLHRLAQAADALGRDMQTTPLIEKGSIEVRQATQAFNQMQARLLRYVEDRSRLLSAISHDLKTPITRLRLRAEFIEEADIRAGLIKDLDEMQNLTQATLDFMRAEIDQNQRHPVDIAALLQTLQTDAQLLNWSVHLSSDFINLKPYPAHIETLKRCLQNLLENGIKYGKTVLIGLEINDAYLCIHFDDEGEGIADGALEDVFKPFYRLEKSRNHETGGTGLGLSIARHIARAHGGDVCLSNREEGGLRATVSLPL